MLYVSIFTQINISYVIIGVEAVNTHQPKENDFLYNNKPTI